ncbi:MAG: 3-deoxy-manno-octulosonate cytidylyltransferase [Marinifilaceae bacterium]|nr:3-deoxy-manno-octulosonate cytidylyltransferase [Marinifilaceae bacterium]
MRKVIVIPARLSSSRLPNKVLLDLNGKTVLQRVYEQCLKVNVDKVYIATDSQKIKESCQAFTENIILTSASHLSGTDRIAEAVQSIDCDVIINVQGDEPFIEPRLIKELVALFEDKEVQMASAMKRISKTEDLKNSNVVKITVDNNNNALYFSRSIIPYHRDNWHALLNDQASIPSDLNFFRHIGIYAYQKDFLVEYSRMDVSYLEKLEKLEQLRVLENGCKIKMLETNYETIGIDTIEDYYSALEVLNRAD